MNEAVDIVRRRLADGRTIADADVHKLVRSIDHLQRDCSELYQVIGALACAAGLLDNDQVNKALDNAWAAADGELRPHDNLLPFAPKKETSDRVDHASLLHRAESRIDAILRGDHSGWDQAMSALRDEIRKELAS